MSENVEKPLRSMGFVTRVRADLSSTLTLPTLMGRFLHEAQIAFGARDMSWTPIGIIFGAVGPMMILPETGYRQALIVLPIESSHDMDRAAYELAHETVHLLSPSEGGREGSIVLEEGCAEIYASRIAEEIGYSDPRMAQPAGTPYEDARRMALELVTLDGSAVRKLRQLEPHFSNITPDHFALALPHVPRNLAEALCRPFQYSADEQSIMLRAQAVAKDCDGTMARWFAERDAEEASAI